MTQRHIAMVAPPWYPVPPSGYGGIELVVYLLVKGLRELGVNVTLFAGEGSLPGSVILAPTEWVDDLGGINGGAREVTYVSRVIEELKQRDDFDIVHDNAGWTSMFACALADIAPVIHTVHGPLYEPQQTVYEQIDSNVGLVAISTAQRNFNTDLNWVGTVYNAVDTESLWASTRADKEHYLICLARITPDKGQHIAIEVARRTGYRLILAGKVGEERSSRQYFEEQIRPHIDNDAVIYYPNIAGQQKADLLARATALLSPICWPEPFGLAMVEAMVSGTPALALSQGAAPELIEEGITGHAVTTADELVECVNRISEIDPVECAARSRDEFSAIRMAQRYLAIYESVISGDISLLKTGQTTSATISATQQDTSSQSTTNNMQVLAPSLTRQQ